MTDGAAQEQGVNGCSGKASLRVERQDGGDGGAKTTAAAVTESRRLGNNSSDSSTVLYKRPSNYTRHRGPESYSEWENRKKKREKKQQITKKQQAEDFFLFLYGNAIAFLMGPLLMLIRHERKNIQMKPFSPRFSPTPGMKKHLHSRRQCFEVCQTSSPKPQVKASVEQLSSTFRERAGQKGKQMVSSPPTPSPTPHFTGNYRKCICQIKRSRINGEARLMTASTLKTFATIWGFRCAGLYKHSDLNAKQQEQKIHSGPKETGRIF